MLTTRTKRRVATSLLRRTTPYTSQPLTPGAKRKPMFWNVLKALMSEEQRQKLKTATTTLSQIAAAPQSAPTSTLIMWANPELVLRATPDDLSATAAEEWMTTVLTAIMTELDRRFPVPAEVPITPVPAEVPTTPSTPDPDNPLR